MAKDRFDGQVEGQMGFDDIFELPERLFAVSRIFARARKEMSLAEQKTFVYALSELKFTEEAKSNYVRLDKKTLANILGIHSDSNHLSVDLFDEIKDLPRHSYITIAEKDLDFYSSGFVVTNVTSFKNMVRIKFEEDYLSLFTGLSTNYITMWSSDIFKMTSRRSVQFYEYLRQITDTRDEVNHVGLRIKALKEMFDIPKEGKGSYMRDSDKGGFDRANYEKKVIEPLCEDLAKCKMISLVVQPDGKYYEKVKNGNRVQGYRFYWTFSARPSVATASEVKKIQERVDANPEVLKVAKDIVAGKERPKKRDKQGEKDKPVGSKTRFASYDQRDYDTDEFAEFERKLLQS